MNLILIEPTELEPGGVVTLTGRRARHVREVLGAAIGDELRVGVVGGDIGLGKVLALGEETCRLAVSLTSSPPARPGLDVILALPRPKALRRILPALASLGVDRIALVRAARVDKSYFASPVLQPDAVRALLLEGLEQARDTVMPEVSVHELLRPFVEDDLEPWLARGHSESPDVRLIAEPGASHSLTDVVSREGRRVVLAVGPDGGWVPFELDLFAARGFTPVSAGPRPLRVEVAVPYLLGLLAAAAGR